MSVSSEGKIMQIATSVEEFLSSVEAELVAKQHAEFEHACQVAGDLEAAKTKVVDAVAKRFGVEATDVEFDFGGFGPSRGGFSLELPAQVTIFGVRFWTRLMVLDTDDLSPMSWVMYLRPVDDPSSNCRTRADLAELFARRTK